MLSSRLPPAAQPAPGEGKRQQVQRLLDFLRADLTERSSSDEHRCAVLEQLKIFGRDQNQSDPIFTEEGIKTLCQHGFDANEADVPSAREASRCLANAMLIVPSTRQIFVNLGYAQKAALRYKVDNVDDEFVLGRILFLTTYETNVDLKALVDGAGLEESIDNALERHAARADKGKNSAPSMETMALQETAKLMFNVSHFLPREKLFSRSVPSLLTIVRFRELPSFPLQPPILNILNALVNIDIEKHRDQLFPESDPLSTVSRLIDILDKATAPQYTKASSGTDGNESWDDSGTSLIVLLRNILAFCPEDVGRFLKNSLLPSEEERNQPLGKGTSIPARLLQLTAGASAPNTREHISYLLFELSSSSPEEFIHNVGYGHASGFLITHNIPFPESAISASTSVSGRPINPITGQALDAEPDLGDPFAGMSQEEQEREAERLFVLFERLRATGVVDVENPVRVAMEQGRLEEISDEVGEEEVD